MNIFSMLFAGYLASLNEPETIDVAVNEYKIASNMTDQLAALNAICQNPGNLRSKSLADFYEQWKEEALVCSQNYSEVMILIYSTS